MFCPSQALVVCGNRVRLQWTLVVLYEEASVTGTVKGTGTVPLQRPGGTRARKWLGQDRTWDRPGCPQGPGAGGLRQQPPSLFLTLAFSSWANAWRSASFLKASRSSSRDTSESDGRLV